MEHLPPAVPPFLLWPGASRDGRMAVGKRKRRETSQECRREEERRRGFRRKSAENDDGDKSLVFVLNPAGG